MNKAIILLDGDGVTLDTPVSMKQWIKDNVPEDKMTKSLDSIEDHECTRTGLLPIIGDRYFEMGKVVYGLESTLETPLMHGAEDAIEYLATKGEVMILTNRDSQSADYLDERLQDSLAYKHISKVSSTKDREFRRIQEYHGSKKAGIAQALGAVMFVDDDPRHMPEQRLDGCMTALVKPKCYETHSHVFLTPDLEFVMHLAQNYL